MENQSKDANVPNPRACLNISNDEANLNKATSHQSDVHHPGFELNRTSELNYFLRYKLIYNLHCREVKLTCMLACYVN